VKANKALRDEHGPGHVTPAGRSVFYDLFPRDKADELVMRATLLSGLECWLKKSELTGAQAAKALRITQDRVSGIKRGKSGNSAWTYWFASHRGRDSSPNSNWQSKLGKLNNDRKETNGCAETSTSDRTKSHSRNKKMAGGKSGKPGRAKATRRTCDGVR
jgi:predicted XRE-type DNA-binding protein